MSKHHYRPRKRERRLLSEEGETLALGVIAAAGFGGASPTTVGFAVKRGCSSKVDAETVGFAIGARLLRRGLVTVTRNNWFILAGLRQ